jgi:CheY-like chemotaxis protein
MDAAMADPAPTRIPDLDRMPATVLLVAADDSLVEVLCVVLKRARIAALVARDAAEALQLLLVHQPAAIVVDVASRGSGQLEFLQAIRRRHRVLALACDDMVADEIPQIDWVSKPLSPRDLLGHLEPLGRDGDPRHHTDGWLLHELAQGRIPVPGKPAVQLVVSCRTRGGELAWTGPQVEDALAHLALGCARRAAGVAERMTHLELIADVSLARGATGLIRSIDITALALAAGLDEQQLAQHILADARGWVADGSLPGPVRVRVVYSRVAAPVDAVRHATPRPLPSPRRAPRAGVFVVAVVAAGIAGYLGVALIVGRNRPAITGAEVAAPAVATVATVAVAQPLAAARPIVAAQVAPPPLVTAVPPRPSPTATLASLLDPLAPLPDPTARVRDFYRLLQQADYDAISLILSAHMREAVPWDPAQLRQRTPSGRLTVLRAERVQPEPSLRDATVAVDVLEQVPPPLTTERRYVGTWHLVRGPSGWLLDEPDIHIE